MTNHGQDNFKLEDHPEIKATRTVLTYAELKDKMLQLQEEGQFRLLEAQSSSESDEGMRTFKNSSLLL